MRLRRALPTDPAVRASGSLFLAETSAQSGSPGRRLLSAGPEPAPAAIAQRMAVTAGSDLLVRRRLMLFDSVPVRIAVSYFDPAGPEAGELAAPAFLGGGLQEIFERHGRRFGHSLETLVARPAEPAEAQLLQIEGSEPVVEILRTSYDEGGVPVHTLQTICAASRHEFVVTPRPGDGVF